MYSQQNEDGTTTEWVEEIISWVQCGIPSCLKWRKLRGGAADEVASSPDVAWECSMNKDVKFNKCEVPEEDEESENEVGW